MQYRTFLKLGPKIKIHKRDSIHKKIAVQYDFILYFRLGKSSKIFINLLGCGLINASIYKNRLFR